MEKLLVDLSDLSEMLGVSQRTIKDEVMKRKDFPSSVSLGPRMKRWKRDDIVNWVNNLKEGSQ